MALSRPEKMVLAYSRIVSGTLSLIASAAIVNKIVLSSRKRREHLSGNNVGYRAFLATTSTYQRILLGLSMLDMLYSFWAALSTFPVPASTGVVFGYGNTMTCSMQGFFTQFSAATPVYIAALTTYFMLRIRYNISEEVLRKKYEFWFHFLPILVAVGGAVIGASLQIFNPIRLPELGCWIAPYPANCQLKGGTCTKGYRIGELSDFYAWSLAFVWFFLSFFVVLVNSILIYTFMVQQERKLANDATRVPTNTATPGSGATADMHADRSGLSSQLEPSSHLGDGEDQCPEENVHIATRTSHSQARQPVKTSRIAAVQCLLYVSTALLTTVWTVMPWIGKKMGVSTQARFFFAFMLNICNPSQGVFNLIIFVRLQYLRLRATEPGWSRLQCIQYCLFSAETK